VIGDRGDELADRLFGIAKVVRLLGLPFGIR